MKLVSVNTGLPREVSWHGRMVTAGIFKEPVKGRAPLRMQRRRDWGRLRRAR